RESVPGRRVPGRCQGRGADGGARSDDQRQLRRVYPCPCVECRAHRIRSVLGRARGDSGDLRDAWTCLFRNLEITKGQSLVLRGATSSFGQAALNMAVNAGAHVIATTRSEKRFPMLRDLGASRVEIEVPDLSKRIAEAKQLDAVLDLVGNSTILDSLNMLRRGGRACLAGWLGGLAPIAGFNPLLPMASGGSLTFFGSFVFGTPGFPLSDVPCRTSQRTSRKVSSRPSHLGSFASRRFVRRIA